MYHDMNGLWAARRHDLRPVVVVLDNDGGGIFDFLPHAQHPDVFEELFATPLGLRMEDVARLYGLDYQSAADTAALRPALRAALTASEPAMVHVRFSRASSVEAHRACWRAVAAALGA
jgi:2-succinyl-5-enolpyruvyl-6-hydroxy-3-cyclohexene-1-carboxylate synthase